MTSAQRHNARQDQIWATALSLKLPPKSQDEKILAERKWRAPTMPSKAQLPCDVGLFSDERDQLDLVEMFQDPTND